MEILGQIAIYNGLMRELEIRKELEMVVWITFQEGCEIRKRGREDSILRGI